MDTDYSYDKSGMSCYLYLYENGCRWLTKHSRVHTLLCVNTSHVPINIVLMNYSDERSNRRMPCHRGVANDYAS